MPANVGMSSRDTKRNNNQSNNQANSQANSQSSNNNSNIRNNRRINQGNAINRRNNNNIKASQNPKSLQDINMSSYGKMITQIKENFSDIKSISDTQEDCTICCKAADIFGIGNCRHPVCIECAIRIRIISKQNVCPVCRSSLNNYYFVFASQGLADCPLQMAKIGHKDEDRYGVRFQNPDACERYEQYLSHTCKKCKNPDGSRMSFPNFIALRQHMLVVHQLSYCGICTDNLSSFSRERKTYNKAELQRHTSHGDGDYNSQKGHPQCLFCPERFFDEEGQYRHLRKDHFFCQLCDLDHNTANRFFKQHFELIKHYKESHFLCPVSECTSMGIAFATSFDLDVHKSREHSSTKTFSLFPDRPTGERNRFRNNRQQPVEATPPPPPVPQPTREVVVVRSAQSSGASLVGRSRFTDMTNDFPSLSGSAPIAPSERVVVPSEFPRLSKTGRPNQQAAKPKKPANPQEDFPSLGGSSRPQTAPTTTENWRKHTGAFEVIDDDERAGSVSQTSNIPQTAFQAPRSVQVRSAQKKEPACGKKPSPAPIVHTEDFPALPSSTALSNTSNWAAKAKKSAITGVRMPNKKNNLPLPDMWPETSTVSSKPYEAPPPEEWKEVPVTKKMSKKEKKEQQRKVQEMAIKEAEKLAEEELAESRRKMLEPPDEDLEMQAALMRDIQASSNIQKVEESSSKSKKKKNKCASNEKKKDDFSAVNSVIPTTKKEQGKQSNKNHTIAKVQTETPSETPSEENAPEGSLTSWLKCSVSSMFSGLSLSNIMGDYSAPLTSFPSTPVNQTESSFGTPSSNSTYATPPGIQDSSSPISSDGVSKSSSSVVYTAPPGFENIVLDSSSSENTAENQNKTPQMFSMAPFISKNDVKPKSAPLSNIKKEEDGWIRMKK